MDKKVIKLINLVADKFGIRYGAVGCMSSNVVVIMTYIFNSCIDGKCVISRRDIDHALIAHAIDVRGTTVYNSFNRLDALGLIHLDPIHKRPVEYHVNINPSALASSPNLAINLVPYYNALIDHGLSTPTSDRRPIFSELSIFVNVVRLIRDRGECKFGDLAEVLLADQHTIIGLLTKMVAKGIVAVVESTDQMLATIHITLNTEQECNNDGKAEMDISEIEEVTLEDVVLRLVSSLGELTKKVDGEVVARGKLGTKVAELESATAACEKAVGKCYSDFAAHKHTDYISADDLAHNNVGIGAHVSRIELKLNSIVTRLNPTMCSSDKSNMRNSPEPPLFNTGVGGFPGHAPPGYGNREYWPRMPTSNNWLESHPPSRHIRHVGVVRNSTILTATIVAIVKDIIMSNCDRLDASNKIIESMTQTAVLESISVELMDADIMSTRSFRHVLDTINTIVMEYIEENYRQKDGPIYLK